jgi:copper(I)-binding protein
MIRHVAFAAALVALPAAASAAIVVEKPEVRATIGAQPTAAGYLVLRNTGKAPDKLIGAACACASEVMAHRTVTANGVARMAMEAEVTIPAGGSVAFAPGDRHLMLTGVKAPIKAGARVPIVLTFEKAGRMTVAFTASDTAGAPATTGVKDQHAH